MRLVDQTRQQADQAVTAMVNQLTGLQAEAAWFATERLRATAITETLLYWSGLSRTVPSHPAQEAWERAWSAQRRQPTEELHATRAEWLAAWEAWARARPS
jgi:hypothetical protein